MNLNPIWANKTEYEKIYTTAMFMGQIAEVRFISRHTGNISKAL